MIFQFSFFFLFCCLLESIQLGEEEKKKHLQTEM